MLAGDFDSVQPCDEVEMLPAEVSLMVASVGEGEGEIEVPAANPPAANGETPITIHAGSDVGGADMDLLIDGVVVQSWSDIGGSPTTGQFNTYSYNATGAVTADQIRVAYTNDFWDPINQIDRNLEVDKIVVNGATFETEHPTVFSTGTYVPSAGTIVPGNWQSETLHSEGYFQYSNAGGSGGSTIEIHAGAEDGPAEMQLLIDGVPVQTWSDVDADAEQRQFDVFTFVAPNTVTADQVRVAFTEDFYDEAAGIDRNLVIDKIVIDGQTFETEDPSVFSTGTYVEAQQSIVPGYWEEEILNSEGYFQYAAATGSAGFIALQTNSIIVDETEATARVQIRRTGGSSGQISVDFTTFALSATPGQDYVTTARTLVFEDGVTVRTASVPLIDDGLKEPVEQFRITIDNVNGGAALLAPRTAVVNIVDDETVLPNYDNFNPIDGLTLNGDAFRTGTQLALTRATSNVAGSAFFNEPVVLDNDGSFRTSFRFKHRGQASGGAGLTFTIQNDPRGPNALGGAGSSQLGYRGIENSVAVEFDTLENYSYETNDNHVSILNGSVTTPLATAVPDFDLNDRKLNFGWIDYNGTSDSLSVYVSRTSIKPEFALLKTTIDLEAAVGDEVYLGFTASTGAIGNSHRIQRWNVDQIPPAPNPPTSGGDQVVASEIISNLALPTDIDWLPDGTMLIAEKEGVVVTQKDGVFNSDPFIDISAIVNNKFDRGLISIAVHPDFIANPFVYLFYAYDPPEVLDQPTDPIAGVDGEGNRAGQLMRVTADVSNGYLTAVPGSEVILLGNNSTWENFNGFVNSTNDFTEPPAGENPDGTYLQDFIATDSESHTVGDLAWGIDGSLFASIGDGASFNQVDVRADRVQDIDSLSGKVLRINPLTGQGYSDNPFYDGNLDSNRSKVYQLGLRNPFRLAVDSATGQLYVGEVGWGSWEEVNAAGPGANFGWPFYEGGSSGSEVQPEYAATPEGQAFFQNNVTVTAPTYALDHIADDIDALILGQVYRGSYYGGEFIGDMFYNNLGRGIVTRVSFDSQGNVLEATEFATGAEFVVTITVGPDGALYYVDLDSGTVGRWDLT